MRRNGFNSGITLIALIITIIVMLILAGVSLNAVIGDNGILNNAINTTTATSIAVLQEYLQEIYVGNYDEFSTFENKVSAFVASSEYSSYIYNPARDSGIGSLSYVVDSEGRVLYLIKKSALPDEIKSQLAGGEADSETYEGYQNLIDVYGVTTDLKVYYCNNGADSITGLTVAELDSDDLTRTINFSDSNMKTLLVDLRLWK